MDVHKNDKNLFNYPEKLLDHKLHSFMEHLSRYSSTRGLNRSGLYRKLQEEINKIIFGMEYGFYAPKTSLPRKKFYRVVAWNVERGIHFEGILRILKNFPEICDADIFLLTETDSGMVRSQNRNVAHDLASELKMNYFFAPSYLNLCVGNSVESYAKGEGVSGTVSFSQNKLGLHGNAILSRYPLENLRTVLLPNCKDKMKGKEKRLGCQKALAAEVSFPDQKVTMVCAHLDAHSSQKQRAWQMETILKHVDKSRHPILLGGDLNTSSYNTRNAFFAFCGFWNKVFKGADYVIQEHYPYPDRYFDKPLFDVLRKFRMQYEPFNELGRGTLHYHVDDLKGNYLVREVVPEWCRRVMEKKLRKHGGQVSMKLDWFAGRGLRPAFLEERANPTGASPPKVMSGLNDGTKSLSDHDPILVDINIYADPRIQ